MSLLGILIGLALVWTTSAGWAVLMTAAFGLVVGVFLPRLEQLPGESLRVVVFVGFLLVAALLLQKAAQHAQNDQVGSAVFAMVGALAGMAVGIGGLANIWALSRLTRDKTGPMTRFFARHFNRR